MNDALVGFMGVALGAALGGLVTFRATRLQLAHATATHEAQLQHERVERTRAERAALYVDLLAFMLRARLTADRVEPVMGPVPAPPEVTDDESMVMQARLETYASDAVRVATQEFFELFNRTMVEARLVRHDRETQHLRQPGDPTAGDMKTHYTLRRQLVPAYDKVSELIRAELAA